MVVFSEADQRLVSLNTTAASVFLELRRGIPGCELPHLLVSKGLVEPGNAQQWVEAAFDVLGSQGLLEGRGPAELLSDTPPGENRLVTLRVSKMPPFRPGKGMIERRYR